MRKEGWGFMSIVLLVGCSGAASENICRQPAHLRTCASGATLRGVDVSEYDGAVHWAKVREAGIVFAFARISDGTAYPDAYFRENWQGMRKSGIVRGAYQYFRAGADPLAQASLVIDSLQQAGGLRLDDLPVVMDVETADDQVEATIEGHMHAWLQAIEAATGRAPILYTSNGTYPVRMATFSGYPLWVANYGADCPLMPTGWSGWSFWQYSSTGSVAGIGASRVDLDEFEGTFADLTAFGGDAGAAMDASQGAPPEAAAQAALGAGRGRAMGQAGLRIAALDASVAAPDADAVSCEP